MTFSGDWNRAQRILAGAPKVIPRAIQQAVLQEAHDLRRKMIAGIDGGGPGGAKFAAHSPLTLVVRRMRGGAGSRGSKILVASAALRNSISVVSVGGGAFVGVLRTRRHSSGKSAVDIARIHEYGKTWTMPLTPRMRRFLFAAIRKAGLPPRPRAKGSVGASSITIRIPPRPFIGPVVATHNAEAFKRKVAEAITAAVRSL